MTDITKDNTKLAIIVEDTEGVYKAPTNADFIQTTEDGATIEHTRESKARNVMSGDRVKKDLRLSFEDVSGTLPVELKSTGTPGDAPKYGIALESWGMSKSQLTAKIVTTAPTANPDQFIQVTNAEKATISENDVLLIKESDESAASDHLSPVAPESEWIDNGDGTWDIKLVIAASANLSTGVQVEKVTNYKQNGVSDSTLSVTRIFEGNELEERATGMRCSGWNVGNFVTGEYPTLGLNFTGLNYDELANSSSFVPVYDDGEPPLVLKAKVYKDGVEICVNEFALTAEQGISSKRCTKNGTGKESTRATGKQGVSGTFNPYKDGTASSFSLDDTKISIFVYAANYSDTLKTEISDCVAFWIPEAKITSISLADVDGYLADSIAFESVPSSATKGVTVAVV